VLEQMWKQPPHLLPMALLRQVELEPFGQRLLPRLALWHSWILLASLWVGLQEVTACYQDQWGRVSQAAVEVAGIGLVVLEGSHME